MNYRQLYCLLIFAAAIGQSPPATAAEAAAAKPAAEETKTAAVPTQKVPFLGMATIATSPQERTDAGLPSGVGLTVQHVLKGSPAEAAGLEKSDVLHKLNDQILVNDPQFRVLLRNMRPGEKIELTFVRRGKPRSVPVTLREVEIPVEDVPAGELLRWLLRPRSHVEPDDPPDRFLAKYEDDQYVLNFSTDGKDKRLTAKNKKGDVLFDGSVNTPQQRDAVPEALRPILKQLESPPK
jgi:hypothetical protein